MYIGKTMHPFEIYIHTCVFYMNKRVHERSSAVHSFSYVENQLTRLLNVCLENIYRHGNIWMCLYFLAFVYMFLCESVSVSFKHTYTRKIIRILNRSTTNLKTLLLIRRHQNVFLW